MAPGPVTRCWSRRCPGPATWSPSTPGWRLRPVGWPASSPRAGTPPVSPARAPSRCSGRSGRPRAWPTPGVGPRSRAGCPVPGQIAIWTRWSRCSRRRPATATGCRTPARPSSWTTSRARTCRPTRWPTGRRPVGRSGWSPPRGRPGGSGTRSPSPGCRRAAGPTCGCAARCSAPSCWPTCWTTGRPATTRWRCCAGRCSTMSCGCSTWRSAGPGSSCWSRRCATWKSCPRRSWTWSTRRGPEAVIPPTTNRASPSSGRSPWCRARWLCRPWSPSCARSWSTGSRAPAGARRRRSSWPGWRGPACPARIRPTGTGWPSCPATARAVLPTTRCGSHRPGSRRTTAARCAGCWNRPAAPPRHRWPRGSAR